jgi:hypothetical protein
MKLVELTLQDGARVIYVNIAHIVSIRGGMDTTTEIELVNGQEAITVAESMHTVLQLIKPVIQR